MRVSRRLPGAWSQVKVPSSMCGLWSPCACWVWTAALGFRPRVVARGNTSIGSSSGCSRSSRRSTAVTWWLRCRRRWTCRPPAVLTPPSGLRPRSPARDRSGRRRLGRDGRRRKDRGRTGRAGGRWARSRGCSARGAGVCAASAGGGARATGRGRGGGPQGSGAGQGDRRFRVLPAVVGGLVGGRSSGDDVPGVVLKWVAVIPSGSNRRRRARSASAVRWTVSRISARRR